MLSDRIPKLSVALHCGSVSARHAEYPRLQKAAAMAIDEHVLPQPPFWFTSAITCVLGNLIARCIPLHRHIQQSPISIIHRVSVHRRTCASIQAHSVLNRARPETRFSRERRFQAPNVSAQQQCQCNSRVRRNWHLGGRIAQRREGPNRLPEVNPKNGRHKTSKSPSHNAPGLKSYAGIEAQLFLSLQISSYAKVGGLIQVQVR